MKPITMTLTSEEAEEILSGLRLRMGQKNWTDKDLTSRVANKLEAAALPVFGWTPGVWVRKQHPPIIVNVRKGW
jgi:hypothetical protein